MITVGLMRFTLFVMVFTIVTSIFVVSCGVCGCSNKFDQITFNDGHVEYYPAQDVSNNNGMLKIIVRDSLGNVLSQKYIPHSAIKAVDEIEGDMPKTGDTTVVVRHNTPVPDSAKLPSNIKRK